MSAARARPEDGQLRPTRLLQTHGSTLVEKVMEYRFLGAVTAELLRRQIPFEVYRSEFDRDGHDLIIEVNGIVRHIQLKSKAVGGKRASVTINTGLTRKPSPCVIWILYDPCSFEIASLRWFGGSAGDPLPDLGEHVAHHSRANAEGLKALRPLHRVLPSGRFAVVDDVAALVDRLFMPSASTGLEILQRHLQGRTIESSWPAWLKAVVECQAFGSIPQLTWDQSIELAHAIDGYKLAEEAGLGDPHIFAERQLEIATATGAWSGGSLELWITLFLEHRRWRFAGPFEPDEEMTSLLDRLVKQLRAQLLGPTTGDKEEG
jgi:hypothetical protein